MIPQSLVGYYRDFSLCFKYSGSHGGFWVEEEQDLLWVLSKVLWLRRRKWRQ